MPVISAENACSFVAFLACETQDFASLLGYFNYIAVVMVCFLSLHYKTVETQNLASPEQRCAGYQCEECLFFVAFLACETQDFASLLGYFNYIAVVMVCFLSLHYKTVETQNLASPVLRIPTSIHNNAITIHTSLLVRRKILRLYLGGRRGVIVMEK